MRPNVRYRISATSVARETPLGEQTNVDERDLTPFLLELGKRVPFDTGWLPPGVRSYTQTGEYSQAVIVLPPGINLINWGESEGDPYATVYRLAQPGRVILADWREGNLLGARMFYSPTPVNSLDQPLYHQNVPNLNCMGYRRTGVGWVCLYSNRDTSQASVGERILDVIERCSGTETFNDANMIETDGPRFYNQRGYPSYTWDPKEWEAKTEAEGVAWTLDPDVWIPVLVLGEHSQSEHTPDGIPLTLRMALNGQVRVSYYDDAHPKPPTALRTHNHVVSPIPTIIAPAFNAAPALGTGAVAVVEEVVPVLTCKDCGEGFPHAEMTLLATAEEVYTLCSVCKESYRECEYCKEWFDTTGDHEHPF